MCDTMLVAAVHCSPYLPRINPGDSSREAMLELSDYIKLFVSHVEVVIADCSKRSKLLR